MFDVDLADFPHTVCLSISLWIVVVRNVIISAFAVTSGVLFFPSEHQKVCRSCM